MNSGASSSTPTKILWSLTVQRTGENRDTDFTISDPTLSRFHLFYYSSTVVGKDPKDTLLIIDTRGVKVQTDNLEDDYDDVEEDPLANAIQTK